MAFLCPVRIRRNKKKHGHLESDLLSGTRQTLPHMGRITGSASIETLVRVGIEKEHGLSPDSKMIVLHDFTPCVDDELEVRRGQVVNVLYQENDWVYVISQNQQQEGFIPFSYCAPLVESHLDSMLTYKKKMPRSGPGSVVSAGAFNDMAEPAVSRVDSHKMATEANFVDAMYGSGANKQSDPLLDHGNGVPGDVNYLLNNLNAVDGASVRASEFGTIKYHHQRHLHQQHGSSYSPTASMPVESSSSQKHFACDNTDLVSNTGHPAHGPMSGSVAAPSMVSACSNGARSNLSSTHHHSQNNSNSIVNGHGTLSFKNSLPKNSTHHEANNDQAYPPTATYPAKGSQNGYNCYGTVTRVAQTGIHSDVAPTNPMVNLDSYFTNSYQMANENGKEMTTGRRVQLGELQPFFKESSGRYIVLFTFVARDENDISVERGEVVTVLNKDDANWFWVLRSDSHEGFVPAIYICPVEIILNAHHAGVLLTNQTSGKQLNPVERTNSVGHHHNPTTMAKSHSANTKGSGFQVPTIMYPPPPPSTSPPPPNSSS